MKITMSLLGCMLLVSAAGSNALTGPDKKQPTPLPPEKSVTDYASTTHGTVQVLSVRRNPTDWFDVLRDGKRAFAGNPPLLNKTVKLLPGTYEVIVNRTKRNVAVTAGKKTILWTGELLVQGKSRGAFWIPKQGKQQMLANAPPLLNRSVPLFPGTYTVVVHAGVSRPATNLGNATVKAGRTTVLQHK